MPNQLIAIQVLRAAAALMVAFSHAQHDGAAVAARTGRAFEPILRLPWSAGVDIFFVISGFIMVHASERLFRAPGGGQAFLARRVARIVPLYWATTTLFLAVALAAPALLNREVVAPWPVVASYLFIPFERPDGLAQPIYSLGWTLNYEMFFYAAFALCVALPRRRAVAALGTAFAALAFAGRSAGPLPQPLAFWTDPIILEFVMGLLIGEARASGLRLSGLVRGGLALAGVAILAADLTGLGLPRFLAHGGPAALLVAAAALGRPEEARAPGPLLRLGGALGDASYALYLIHPFVIRAGREAAVRSGLADLVGPWGYLVLVTGLAAAASYPVWRWFERPVTEAVRRRLDAPGLARGAQVAREPL